MPFGSTCTGNYSVAMLTTACQGMATAWRSWHAHLKHACAPWSHNALHNPITTSAALAVLENTITSNSTSAIAVERHDGDRRQALRGAPTHLSLAIWPSGKLQTQTTQFLTGCDDIHGLHPVSTEHFFSQNLPQLQSLC
jgi:hypothetical protein